MTYKKAYALIMSHLEDNGWAVKRGLKVPHATSPDGDRRLYFKAQAVYLDHGGPFKLGTAHSLHLDDIRDGRMNPADVERLALTW